MERPRTFINRNQSPDIPFDRSINRRNWPGPRPSESPDIPFDRSINPYRGCEHGPNGIVG